MNSVMKVLITGNGGYIGVLLCDMLSKSGYDITGLDTYFFEHSQLEDYSPPPKIIRKDIRDLELKDVQGYEAIIHLAGLSNDPLGSLNPSLTMEINYNATIRLAELAKAAKVKKFIFSSTCSVYGNSKHQFIDEEGELNPVTPYALSKAYAEIKLKELSGMHFQVISLRNATVFGYTPMTRMDLVVNNFCAWGLFSNRILLKSTGQSSRPFIHVSDVCRAIMAVLSTEIPAYYSVYNVSNRNLNIKVNDLAQIIALHLPSAKVEYVDQPVEDLRNYTVSSEKYYTTFSRFAPKLGIDEGVIELKTKLQQTGITSSDIEGQKLSRLASLISMMTQGTLSKQLHWIHG